MWWSSTRRIDGSLCIPKRPFLLLRSLFLSRTIFEEQVLCFRRGRAFLCVAWLATRDLSGKKGSYIWAAVNLFVLFTESDWEPLVLSITAILIQTERKFCLLLHDSKQSIFSPEDQVKIKQVHGCENEAQRACWRKDFRLIRVWWFGVQEAVGVLWFIGYGSLSFTGGELNPASTHPFKVN